MAKAMYVEQQQFLILRRINSTILALSATMHSLFAYTALSLLLLHRPSRLLSKLNPLLCCTGWRQKTGPLCFAVCNFRSTDQIGTESLRKSKALDF